MCYKLGNQDPSGVEDQCGSVSLENAMFQVKPWEENYPGQMLCKIREICSTSSRLSRSGETRPRRKSESIRRWPIPISLVV